MLKNKGVTITVITVIILIGLVLFISKGADQPTVPVEEIALETTVTPAEETTEEEAIAEPAPEPTEITEVTEAEATETVTPADAASESLLAAPVALQIDVTAAMQDRVLGNPDAPVTIIEYASFTCPHCAHYATTIFPEVKKRLIDTGKVRFIFRDFPLDNAALRASMMTRCAPAEGYHNLSEVVFSNQERWTRAEDPLQSLAQLGSLAGIDGDTFKACIENKELETAILSHMQEAQTKYSVRSTPSFVFNEGAEGLSGAQPVEKFEEIVNKLSQGQ